MAPSDASSSCSSEASWLGEGLEKSISIIRNKKVVIIKGLEKALNSETRAQRRFHHSQQATATAIPNQRKMIVKMENWLLKISVTSPLKAWWMCIYGFCLQRHLVLQRCSHTVTTGYKIQRKTRKFRQVRQLEVKKRCACCLCGGERCARQTKGAVLGEETWCSQEGDKKASQKNSISIEFGTLELALARMKQSWADSLVSAALKGS